jgi:hypothetical protein
MDWEILVLGVSAVSFIGACVLCLKLIYHSAMMLGNIKHNNASFLGPFIVFFPSLLNETGQKHWRSYPPTFLVFAVCVVLLFICYEYLGVGNS